MFKNNHNQKLFRFTSRNCEQPKSDEGWLNRVCKGVISRLIMNNKPCVRKDVKYKDTTKIDTPVVADHDTPEKNILIQENQRKSVLQDKQVADPRFTKQSTTCKKQEPLPLSKKATDEITQRLKTDTIRRNTIKANRLKQQMDLAALETVNLFSDSHYSPASPTHKEPSIVVLNNNKRSLFEESHQILIC